MNNDEAFEITTKWFHSVRDRSPRNKQWKEYLIAINSHEYDLIKNKKSTYLVSRTGDKKGRRIVFNADLLINPNKLPDFLPEYISNVHDLKRTKPGMLSNQYLQSTGGIASDPGLQNVKTMFEFDSRRLEKIIGIPLTENPDFPDNLYFFQYSITGRPFFVNVDLDIVIFDREEEKLKRVGSLNNFINYCLYFFNEGKDWYGEGYYKDMDTVYFDLKYFS